MAGAQKALQLEWQAGATLQEGGGYTREFCVYPKSSDKLWKYFKQAGELSEERVELEYILE